MELKAEYYRDLVRKALREDLGAAGDVSSLAVFTHRETGTFKLLAKQAGILCGSVVFSEVFRQVDKKLRVEFLFKDGNRLSSGDIVARVRGPVRSILQGERTALNFISHLSGIATRAAELTATAKKHGGETPVRILDTRKTLPGFRMLQKYAVRTGGAENHRIGLFDMVMLKDNHIDAVGGISNAVRKVRERWGDRYKIEVEARTLEDVKEALSLGIDRIMLDNMDNAMIAAALKIARDKVETEASGNMTEARLAELAGSGLTYISFGELTHSVKVFDFSLKHEKTE